MTTTKKSTRRPSPKTKKAAAKRAAAKTAKPPPSDRRLYTLDVFLLSGPISEGFVRKNPSVGRTIQIRGDQTLAELHNAIFDAFDRWDEHLYEFQFGKGPMDPKGPRYALHDTGDDNIAGLVSDTTIASLGLKVGRRFGYWFDFGDDWFHQIDVTAIDAGAAKGRFPKLIKRVGKSPPQYPDE